MNHLCVIFYFINIFAAYVNSASIGSAADMFDIESKNFSKSCPALSNSILVNSTSKYFSSNCKDLSFKNLPTKIKLFNINKFYCIGILVADIQLCNYISTYEYTKLPKTLQELETEISKIQTIKTQELCRLLKSYNLFNDENIPKFANTVIILKKELTGDGCVKFCSEYENDVTNELCAMIYYIYDHIKNISEISTQKQVVELTTDTQKTDMNMTVKLFDKLPNGEIDKKRVLSHIQSITSTNKSQAHIEPADVQQNYVTMLPTNNSEKKVNKTILQQVSQDSANKEASPTVKDEIQSTQTKSNDYDTNKTQKEMKVLGEKSTESSALVDNKVETTTTISTELNFVKQHSDTIEYDDDGDIDDTGKLTDDTNPMADNIPNGRTEFNPNKQTVDVEEESNFFSYFMFFSVMFIAGYVVYHNKQKIMALILEGRRDRNSRRRPSTSSYRKLNSNLEEAVTSKCSGSASHVIY